MKFFKYTLITLIILFIGIFILLATSRTATVDRIYPDIEKDRIFAAHVQQYAIRIRTIFERIEATTNQPINPHKVIFKYPDTACSKNSNLCVFDEKNGGIKLFNAEVYKDVNDGTPLIFTLGNRVTAEASDQTELMMILVHPKPRLCEFIQQQNEPHRGIPELKHAPNLTPHPAEVELGSVVNLPNFFGCVKTPDGLFAYWLLLAR